MTKSQLTKAIAQIDKHMKGVAEQRDKLDDAISDMEELREHCIEAYDDLQRARDALSRLV